MSSDLRQASHQVKRSLNTFSHLTNGASILREKAAANEQGSYYLTIASILFSALAFEALLNHVGSKKCACWNLIERKLSPKEKLKLLGKKIELQINWNARPYQTVVKLIEYRNALAHGRSDDFDVTTPVPINTQISDASVPPKAKTDWERCSTSEFAERADIDVTEIIVTLFGVALPNENPFLLEAEEHWLDSTVTMTVFRPSDGESMASLPSGAEGGEA
jgi:hypothetical protein